METYTHKVAAIYHSEVLARQALEKLHDSGFSETQLRLIGPQDPHTDAKLEPEGKEVPKTIIRDALVGAGLGGAVGAAGTAALVVAEMALFATNPVLAALTITGYAATIGGVAGALKGLKLKETAFLGVVEEALRYGYWAVVVHAKDHHQEEQARQQIAETGAERDVRN